MNSDGHSLISFLATLLAIVFMTLSASAICIYAPLEHLSQTVAAVGFIGASTTGLIGVIGTFRPKGASGANVGSADSVTVNSLNKDNSNG